MKEIINKKSSVTAMAMLKEYITKYKDSDVLIRYNKRDNGGINFYLNSEYLKNSRTYIKCCGIYEDGIIFRMREPGSITDHVTTLWEEIIFVRNDGEVFDITELYLSEVKKQNTGDDDAYFYKNANLEKIFGRKLDKEFLEFNGNVKNRITLLQIVKAKLFNNKIKKDLLIIFDKILNEEQTTNKKK